ncbi:MAG TPA: uroporphyrinogen-III C-methyltransferase [Phototrophicaceae bacterium]|jgi:uroporphyrin-III C-methyltransferase|nr:uroporphyrinogen-III C-methyltransferase [Phototrophicaceae bacterium]
MTQTDNVSNASDNAADKIGTVYLVGAGPGDPGLITVKGLNLLRRADVILYDRLAPPELLTEAKPGAELIDVGKMPTRHRRDQGEINRLLVEHAKAGRLVVRLKGGDPLVFGRGGEEALACREAGIPFEIVPGVSSAIAVPAYAGIPVTHRGITSTFTVFTGHEDPDNPANQVDYAALAKIGTLIALMGVSHLPNIVEKLLANGLNPDTPAVCIEWGTTERQRVVEGTLATIVQVATEAQIQPPSITVIGSVVDFRSTGMRWFDEGQL